MSEAQVNREHYFGKKYLTLERFISYFFQLDLVRRTKTKQVLIVGVGDGLIPTYLKNAGFEVTTVDFDQALKPDQVGDIRALSFSNNAFEVVAAFEVLEHIPFNEVEQALRELARVSKSEVLISLPFRRTGFEWIFRVPYLRTLFHRPFLRVAWNIPLRFPGFQKSKQHYWEIDRGEFRIVRIRELLKKYFYILEEADTPLDPYRYFFHLKKI